LADEKRELAKLFGPKSKKKKPRNEPPQEPPAPAPLPVDTPPPAPLVAEEAEGLARLREPVAPLPQVLRAPDMADPEPVWEEASVAYEMAAAKQDEEDMLMLLALITSLEDE
jgi:hypothetical protein